MKTVQTVGEPKSSFKPAAHSGLRRHWVFQPAAKDQQPLDPKLAEAADALVVEDTLVNLKILSRVLARVGFAVCEYLKTDPVPRDRGEKRTRPPVVRADHVDATGLHKCAHARSKKSPLNNQRPHLPPARHPVLCQRPGCARTLAEDQPGRFEDKTSHHGHAGFDRERIQVRPIPAPCNHHATSILPTRSIARRLQIVPPGFLRSRHIAATLLN